MDFVPLCNMTISTFSGYSNGKYFQSTALRQEYISQQEQHPLGECAGVDLIIEEYKTKPSSTQESRLIPKVDWYGNKDFSFTKSELGSLAYFLSRRITS